MRGAIGNRVTLSSDRGRSAAEPPITPVKKWRGEDRRGCSREHLLGGNQQGTCRGCARQA